ncbi:hypothetical protein NUACC26_000930 [Scytonema sp. NUACC26]
MWGYKNAYFSNCINIHKNTYLYLADVQNYHLISVGILTHKADLDYSCGTAPDLHRTFPVTSDGCSPPEPRFPCILTQLRSAYINYNN